MIDLDFPSIDVVLNEMVDAEGGGIGEEVGRLSVVGLAVERKVVGNRSKYEQSEKFEAPAPLPKDVVDYLCQLANLTPDLTLLLDTDPATSLKRARQRAQLDRFEEEDLAFHEKVRDQYLQRSREFPHRIHTIDVTTLDKASIHEKIVLALKTRFGALASLLG